MEDLMNADQFARLVNEIPAFDGNGQCVGTGRMVWDVYSKVLRPEEVTLCINERTPEEQQTRAERLKSLRQKLVVTESYEDLVTEDMKQRIVASPLVKAYNSYQAAYDAARTELNNSYIAAMMGEDKSAVLNWNLNGFALKNKVKAALEQWEANGYKTEYENLVNAISLLSDQHPATAWLDHRNNFQTGSRTADPTAPSYWPTYLFPSNFFTLPWTFFKWSNKIVNHDKTTALLKGKFNLNLTPSVFPAKGEFKIDGVKDDEETQDDFSFETLEFEITKAPLIRPWLASDVFLSRKWRWNSSDELLSDGAANPNGLLPAFISEVIFIRNVKGKFSHGEEFVKSKLAKLNGELTAKVGWGPLSIGGGAELGKESKNNVEKTHIKGNELTIEGAQIIGYVYSHLPKCPNPDF
eukprot:TRINITY_DN14774_c0_g1_i1.p1 TRINITY_DN14774_c0_g1~~TRINITY_DN14774_c0_g1_i1.p1  ORF type:complete len:452 (+),score=89.11 TRINITY_DN14774_c0_g1_i1:128-1357(+)